MKFRREERGKPDGRAQTYPTYPVMLAAPSKKRIHLLECRHSSKRDDASRLRDAERCMKAGKPLTVREASFISLLMGHTERTGAATVRLARADSAAPGPTNPAADGRASKRESTRMGQNVRYASLVLCFLSFFLSSLPWFLELGFALLFIFYLGRGRARHAACRSTWSTWSAVQASGFLKKGRPPLRPRLSDSFAFHPNCDFVCIVTSVSSASRLCVCPYRDAYPHEALSRLLRASDYPGSS